MHYVHDYGGAAEYLYQFSRAELMSIWFSLQLIYFAFGISMVVSQYLGLNDRWLFYPL